MQDEKIVELYWNRDESAIRETQEKYENYLYNIAYNILSDKEDSSESVNDTYLAAWNTIPPQKPNPLRTYVCKITRNIAVTRYHANTAQKRNSHYDIALDELEECLSCADTAEYHLLAKELSHLLDRFLAGLDKHARVMFIRRYWFAEPVTQIAYDLGMRPNSVSVQLSRTRSKLRKFLIKEGYLL